MGEAVHVREYPNPWVTKVETLSGGVSKALKQGGILCSKEPGATESHGAGQHLAVPRRPATWG